MITIEEGSKRDFTLDALRVFGVLVIIIAHSDPPKLLVQLRNFGTPLLIVVSGLTHAYLYSTRQIRPRAYLRHRLSRLIFPAWIFLCTFFGFFLVADWLLDKEFPFNLYEVLTTFTFYGGVGYVWIFKVYIVLALITPVALRFASSPRSDAVFFTSIAVAFCVHEGFLYAFREDLPADWLEFLDIVIFVLVPYAALYLYGMRMRNLTTRSIMTTGAVAAILFALQAVSLYVDTGNFVATQTAKYPPRFYYLAYAFAVVNFAYLAFANYKPGPLARRVVIWLSSSALWIYLWHIFAIFAWGYLVGQRGPSYGWATLMTVVLVTFGVVATALQHFLVQRLLSNSRHGVLRQLGRLLI